MLLRMLDIQAPKVRTSALLIISEVAPAAAHLLAAGVHMRPAVQKARRRPAPFACPFPPRPPERARASLRRASSDASWRLLSLQVLPLAAEKQPELRRAAIDAMLALHAAAPPTFLAQAGQLPLAAQHQLRSLVAADAPELAAQLATARPVARRSTQPEQPRQARPGGGSGLGGTPERGGGTPERGAGCGNESRGGGSESRGGGCRGALDTPPRETSLSGGRAGGGASGGPLREIRPAAKQQDTAHAGALELSGGNEDWLLLMPTLLRALQGGQPEASQREALVKLHKMVLVVRPGAPVWDRHWEHALEAVLRAVPRGRGSRLLQGGPSSSRSRAASRCSTRGTRCASRRWHASRRPARLSQPSSPPRASAKRALPTRRTCCALTAVALAPSPSTCCCGCLRPPTRVPRRARWRRLQRRRAPAPVGCPALQISTPQETATRCSARRPVHPAPRSQALELLLSISDPHRCIAVLARTAPSSERCACACDLPPYCQVPVLVNEPPPTLQLAIRLQSKLVGRFSQLQLLSILPQLLPPLFEAFKNAHADVRKAVVFCLVDMCAMLAGTPPSRLAGRLERRSCPRYLVLGEQLTPHLATLSTAQLKLVTIYINKTTKARADRLDAPHI